MTRLACILVVVLSLVSGQPSAVFAASQGASLDLVLCIDASATVGPNFEMVRRSASQFLDALYGTNVSLRVGFVVYGAGSDGARIQTFGFSNDRDAVTSVLSRLAPDMQSGSDVPMRRAVRTAVEGVGLGGWRPEARRAVVIVGSSAPSAGDESVETVARVARAIGVARLYPILLSGASSPARSAFSELARQTGGLMVMAQQISTLPLQFSHVLEWLALDEIREQVDGRVDRLMGGAFEVRLGGPAAFVHPGLAVLVFSETMPGLVIAEGTVTTGEGSLFVVETRATYTLESVKAGCPVRLVYR